MFNTACSRSRRRVRDIAACSSAWSEYTDVVVRAIFAAKFNIPTSIPLVGKVADLAKRRLDLIAALEAEVGEHVLYNHSTRRGNLVEVELSNGDSFLGYDLVDPPHSVTVASRSRIQRA